MKQLIAQKRFDSTTNDQLRRASFSVMLNIAEGSSRFSNKDRRRFMIISRGSIFECVAILEYLKEVEEIEQSSYDEFYRTSEEISKMLYGLIRKLEQ